MKKIILILFTCMFSLMIWGQNVNPNDHYVQGYYKADGTYVKGYYRTNPNNTNRDNFSTYPNINPYTGKQGTVQPDNKSLDIITPNYKAFQNNLELIERVLAYKQAQFNALVKAVGYKEAERITMQREQISHRKNSSAYPKYNKRAVQKSRTVTGRRVKDSPTDIRPRAAVPLREWERQEPKDEKITIGKKRKPQRGLASTQPVSQNLGTIKQINYHNKFTLSQRLKVETLLRKWGFFKGVVDGYFNAETIRAIEKYQAIKKYEVTGKINENKMRVFQFMN